jgi:hypothetical protein
MKMYEVTTKVGENQFQSLFFKPSTVDNYIKEAKELHKKFENAEQPKFKVEVIEKDPEEVIEYVEDICKAPELDWDDVYGREE